MSKRYISLAIDHGATQSCIARMTADGPEAISTEAGSGILPSTVYCDKRGSLLVGVTPDRP
jgi:molecular chaperone DnaK (HSP70)